MNQNKSFIENFNFMTRDIEPAHIEPKDPEQELLDNVLCGMVMMNCRRQAKVS